MSVAGISSTGAITGTSVNISGGIVTCGIVNSKYVVQTFPITIIGGGGSTNLFLGTFIVPTSIGYVVNVKVYSHMGFNARNDQDYSVDINFKISNGFNFNGSGFNGNSYHLVYDNAFNYNLAGYGSNFIYWVGDAAGGNARSYSLYMYHGSYNDNSFYTVTYSNACSWSTTTQNASPGSPSNTSTCLLSTSITPLSSQSVNADVKFKTVTVSNNSYYYKIGSAMGVSENGMWMNMANDTNGVIQGEYQGIRYNNICLNPNGASVGIGKLNPAYTLDVNGTLNAGAIIGTNSITLNFAGSTQPTLNINANGGGGVGKAIINLQPWIGRGTDSCRIEAVDASNFSTNLGFFTAAGGSTTTTPQNRMTITSNGNVGIGTTTPGYLLDVNGTLNAGVITGSSVNVGTTSGNTITAGNLVISSGASLSGITNSGAITGTSVSVGTASGRTITGGNLVIGSSCNITNAGDITGNSVSVGTTGTITGGNLVVGGSTRITNAGVITGSSVNIGTASGNTITTGNLQVGPSPGCNITNAGDITARSIVISNNNQVETVPTDNNSTRIASTAYVKNQGYAKYAVTNTNFNLSGGGTVTWDGGTVSWSQRVIAIMLNREYASQGFFEIGPATVSIGAGWQALYYVPDNGMGNGYVPSKLIAVSRAADLTWTAPIGENWIFICSVNSDNNSLRWNPGYVVIPSGGTYISSTGSLANIAGTSLNLNSTQAIKGIQVGTKTASATGGTVTVSFPNPFVSTPVVTCTVVYNGLGYPSVSAMITEQTTTYFKYNVFFFADNGLGNHSEQYCSVNWIAICS